MRNLGTQLGVEAMALYHYVHGREDLLDGIVELVIDDLYGDPDVHLSADAWQDYLQPWPTGSGASPWPTRRCSR